MIKVINVSSDSNVGGAGRCVLTFLKNFDRTNFDIVVAVPTGSELIESIKALDVRYEEIDGIAEKSLSFSAVNKFIKLFKKEKPDIVHAHASMSARIAAKMCGIKVVYTRHSVFPNKDFITHGIGKMLCSMVNNSTCDKVIAVAEAAKDNLTETGVKEEKITVIKNGVNPMQKLSEDEIATIKNKYGLKEFVFGIIARVEEIKGHDTFIDAAKMIIDKYDNVSFMICGTGNYFEHVKNRVENEHLTENIKVTGHISDVQTVMNVIDVNVNASFGTEATSLSLLEGMSIGKPIIASKYGGNPELVKEGINGILFETKNDLQLFECMEQLVNDKSYLKSLSDGAKNLFYEKYTSEIYARNIEDVYKSLVKRGDNK